VERHLSANTVCEHKARFLKMLKEEQKQVTAAT
jgi:hypothetical protein